MATGDGLRVLIVEDETAVADTLRVLLKHKVSAHPDLAGDCATARKKFSSSEYDLITLDYQLPDGDGLELLEEINSNDDPPPVIMVTGHGDERTAVEAFRLGASGYVVKDMRMSTLLVDAVRHALSEVSLRRAEDALRESDRKYRKMFENMNEGVAVHELVFDETGKPVDLRVVDVNPQFENILGISAEKAVSMLGSELFGGGKKVNIDAYVDVCARIARTGEPSNFEVYFPPTDKYLWISAFTPVENAVATLFVDITEQKTVEQALRDSESRLREIYESATEGIVVTGADGNFEFVNPRALVLLGYDGPEDMVGKPAVELYANPEDRERLFEIMEKQGFAEGFEFESRNKDGSMFWGRLNAVLHKDADGNMARAVAFVADITEQKAAEEDLRRINEELDAYAHSVSHDLKGPLSAIGAMAGILKDSLGETDEEATREMLEVLNDNAEAAQDRVDDLLKLAESGQKPAEVENIDIGEVIDEILEGLSSRTKENVSVVVYDDMGSITASKPQIRQVFSNLIINAIKHNDSEEPEVRISRMGRTNGTHVFLVQDNGSGIHPEDFETIFTPFRSGRKTGETGIGLSIARKIARIYGGDIRVYKDNGACFEVTLNDYQ